MFRCEVLADSKNKAGVRLTTLRVVFPRFILAEFNTHRMFSRNSASSRAIPLEKRLASVRASPFVPGGFAQNKRGMSAGEPLSEEDTTKARQAWLQACEDMVFHASWLGELGVHKQWANRLIEPFAWHEVVVTATDWDNFFHQRISEHAQPEIREAARLMKEAMDASTPLELLPGGWHLPFITDEDFEDAPSLFAQPAEVEADFMQRLVKLSVARCARVSYLTHDGRRDQAVDIGLHDRLLTQGHMSPFEHAARAEDDTAYRGNFRGFTQYRKLIPREADFLGPEAPQASEPVSDDATGFKVAPQRYMAGGRETIDTLRDRAGYYFEEAVNRCPIISVGDASFYVHCKLTADKYLARQGLKVEATAERDVECARWYHQMADHVVGAGPDPRASRPGFVPYEPGAVADY